MGIKLLDCTLRDDGYINDWKFGYRTAKASFKSWWIPTRTTWKSVLRNCSYDKTQRCSIILELKKYFPEAEKYKIHGDGPS